MAFVTNCSIFTILGGYNDMDVSGVIKGLYLLVFMVGLSSLIISFVQIFFDLNLKYNIIETICAFGVVALLLVIIALSSVPSTGDAISAVVWLILGIIDFAKYKVRKATINLK